MKKVFILISLFSFIIASNTPRLDKLELEYNKLNSVSVKQTIALQKIKKDIEYTKEQDKKNINKNIFNLYKENQNDKYNLLLHRISDIDKYISYYSILITVIVIIFTLIAFVNVKTTVKRQVAEWIEKESENEIKNIIEPILNKIRKAEARIRDIEFRASRSSDKIYQKMKKINNISSIYNNDANYNINLINNIEDNVKTINDFLISSENSLKLIRPSESIYYLHRALELVTKKHEKLKIYNLLGYSYEFLNNYDKSIYYYNLALKIDSKNIETKYNKALCEYNFKNTKEAEDLFKEILIKNNRHCKANQQLSNIYADKNDFDTALSYINEAIDIDNKCYEAYYNKGCILDELGRYIEAIEAYRQAININSDDENSYLNIFELEIRHPEFFEDDKKKYIEDLKESFRKKFENKPNIYIKYEMLEIINKIKNNKYYNIVNWTEKYKNIYIHNWSFKDLEDWNKNNSNNNIKSKVKQALEIFKEHAPDPYTSLQENIF